MLLELHTEHLIGKYLPISKYQLYPISGRNLILTYIRRLWKVDQYASQGLIEFSLYENTTALETEIKVRR